MANAPKSNFFRNCTEPTIDPVAGKVTGKIPEWIEGTLTRNGPGIQEIGPDKYSHFFDGLAYLHRFHISNGKATYNSRPLEGDTYTRNMAAQRIIMSEFGTIGYGDPCDTLFRRFKSMFISDGKTPEEREKEKTGDNTNVNVAYYGDQLYAMTETDFVRRVDPKTLKTIGDRTKLSNYIAVNGATAHPHILEDGTVLNMGSNYRHNKGPHYCIVQVPPFHGSSETSFKDAKIIAEIPCRWKLYPCYYHSFGITSDKIVFIEQPYCLSVPKLMTMGIYKRSFKSVLAWYPKEKTRIYIVSRNTGEIHPVIYETDALFTYHHANAYEKDGQIVLDVSGYNSGEFTNTDVEQDTIFLKGADEALPGAGFRRYVLPLELPKDAGNDNLVRLAGSKATAVFRNDNIIDVNYHQIVPEWFEFPRINYQFNGKEYNFVYGAMASEERKAHTSLPEPDKITKVDLRTGKITYWHSKGILASEPIFVPNKSLANPAEDDGVILVALLHQNKMEKITLLILDAKNMKELAKVEFKTQGAATSTFHGQWATNGDKVHSY